MGANEQRAWQLQKMAAQVWPDALISITRKGDEFSVKIHFSATAQRVLRGLFSDLKDMLIYSGATYVLNDAMQFRVDIWRRYFEGKALASVCLGFRYDMTGQEFQAQLTQPVTEGQIGLFILRHDVPEIDAECIWRAWHGYRKVCLEVTDESD